MSIKIKITIPVDEGSPHVAKIREALQNRRPLHAELGQTAVKGLRAHFLSRPPNKKGWPSQNFWSRIRTATALTEVDETGATIVIDDPAMAQKIYGGTIRPGPGKKYLAIPAIAEAYGRSPLQVDGLIPIFGHRGAGTGLLIKPGPKGSKIGTAWYFLVKSVTQQADAEALPPEAAYRAALLATVDDYFARL